MKITREQRKRFHKEINSMLFLISVYLFVVAFFSYYSEQIGNFKYVLQYLVAPFTIGLTFFVLETYKEKKEEFYEKIKKKELK